MSHNITTWKTKKIEDLIIPISSLYKSKRKDWHPSEPKILNAETMEVEIESGCEPVITGILKNKNLHVTKLEVYGEGSGGFWHYVLAPSLEDSSGILKATLVWEGGEDIEKLRVKNGKVKVKPIKL